MINEKFEDYKKQLLKDEKVILSFKNGYEGMEFSNYLNNNKIYHEKMSLSCIPLYVARFYLIKY